ncbi:hypothetical protein L596_001362 [Steinernema carpocapsae]|uniref:Uncharacterized protein n=1 Tax=Steinernema carpocapsae TaxID=34508 RepID=A0A4V6I739_STECR|nr:hypothetical protein L596_001362 [Steinernema carpocapsae]
MAIRTFVVPARNTVLATGLLPRRRATLLHWRLRFIACGHIHVWRNVSCRTLRLCGPGQDWIQHNEVTLDATTSRFPCSSPKPDLERLLLFSAIPGNHQNILHFQQRLRAGDLIKVLTEAAGSARGTAISVAQLRLSLRRRRRWIRRKPLLKLVIYCFLLLGLVEFTMPFANHVNPFI